MREIKFKAKRVDNDEWIFGDLLHHNEQTLIIEEIEYPSDDYNQNVNPQTIRQFTGLKDKNGTDIYEGDILTSDFHNKTELKVVYHFGGFKLAFNHEQSFCFSPSKNIIGGFEIIGNTNDKN